MPVFGRITASLCTAVFALIVFGGVACAAKDVTVRFTQAAEDCATVVRWDLYYATIGTGDPTTADALLAGALVERQGVCGTETLQAGAVVGIAAGNTRFWLRTVAGDVPDSSFSNPIDEVVPLNAPVLVEILFQ